MNDLTLEVDVDSRVFKLHTLKSFPESLVVVRYGLLGALAEGQRVVGVGLLAVVVRPDGVHPQDHLLVVAVRVIVLVRQDRRRQQRRRHEEQRDHLLGVFWPLLWGKFLI